MEALGKQPDTLVDWWGNGWPGYDRGKSLNENLRVRGAEPYDALYVYKPGEHVGAEAFFGLRVIEYNEMYDQRATRDEIEAFSPHLVICHHENEMRTYNDLKCDLVHIPHMCNPDYFHPYGPNKTVDVVVVGNTEPASFYPLRHKVRHQVLPILQRWGFRTSVYTHPGYDIRDACSNESVTVFAKAIASARIAVFCSGKPKTRYAKYTEVPFCGTAVAADIPDEEGSWFREFVIEIDAHMTAQRIAETLAAHLNARTELSKRTAKGTELSKHLTVTMYAERAREAIVASYVKYIPVSQTIPLLLDREHGAKSGVGGSVVGWQDELFSESDGAAPPPRANPDEHVND